MKWGNRMWGWVVLIGAMSMNAHGGFEVGNGWFGAKAGGAGLLESMDKVEAAELASLPPIFAPLSDGVYPRTRVQAKIEPVYGPYRPLAPETAPKGCATFKYGGWTGLFCERSAEAWNTIRIQLFRKHETLIINLEGNKSKSTAFSNAAESLRNEINW